MGRSGRGGDLRQGDYSGNGRETHFDDGLTGEANDQKARKLSSEGKKFFSILSYFLGTGKMGGWRN
jgi:hypothetical protein